MPFTTKLFGSVDLFFLLTVILMGLLYTKYGKCLLFASSKRSEYGHCTQHAKHAEGHQHGLSANAVGDVAHERLKHHEPQECERRDA